MKDGRQVLIAQRTELRAQRGGDSFNTNQPTTDRAGTRMRGS